MKEFARIVLVISALLVAAALPAYAHGGRMGVGVYVGPGWGYPYYAPYYAPYPYYYEPPVIVEQQPNTYIYQAPQKEEGPSYWYFCQDPEGYYPYVKKCPKGWQKVIPPATPEDGEE